VVIVDDDEAVAQLLHDSLKDLGIEIITCGDSQLALEIITVKRPQIVIADLHMPNISGMELLDKTLNFDPAIEVFLLTGDYSPRGAVEAIQKGAADYLTKPISVIELRARITKALQQIAMNHSRPEAARELASSCEFHGIVTRSPKMLEIFSVMRRIAPHFRSVLVTGRSGTGKELVARALHLLSPVSDGPFVVCNCAGVPETLAESEWFGHVKGAFTGAVSDKSGLFEHAHGGTVFLDEIGEMPFSLQAKLLRVLQTHEIQRIGSLAVRKLDLRVIAATNRNLHHEASQHRFREDLFYRLNAVGIELPPLTERKEDLPLLESHFVAKFAAEYGKNIRGISRRAQRLLSSYHWPGNIRQLANVIANACLMADGPLIDIRHLPLELRSVDQGQVSLASMSLAQIQREHARRVLEMVGGNKLRAAEILGVSRSTLYNLLAS